MEQRKWNKEVLESMDYSENHKHVSIASYKA